MKIKKVVKENINYDREVDYYVPITIEFQENYDKYRISEMMYYRYISKEESMIEMVVDSRTMKISRIVIVSINQPLKKYESDLNFCHINIEVAGNPEIEKEQFSNSKIITVEKEIKFMYFDRNILIIFDEGIKQQIDMRGLKLLLNEEMRIVGIIITDLSEPEWMILKNACEIL